MKNVYSQNIEVILESHIVKISQDHARHEGGYWSCSRVLHY